MNYLAHVYFSFHDENLLVGNVVADLLQYKEVKQLDARYQNGILLHRHIDHVTDNHPIHRENLKILYPSQGKYAPVVMDIFYDYFLGKHWSAFGTGIQRKVCDEAYEILIRHEKNIPVSAGNLIRRMVDDDFLYSCHTFERMEQTFARLFKRVKFKSNILKATDDLQVFENDIELLFLQFFPDAATRIRPIQFG